MDFSITVFIIIYLIIINVIAIIVTITDKVRAVYKKWRITEKTLFMLSALGGSIGMYITMLIIHHKTRKLKFQRNKKASGYEIQYSTNKNFSKATKIKISKNSTTTAVLKKLQNKKKYYIRIRACKKVGKKTYYGYWRSYYVNNN